MKVFLDSDVLLDFFLIRKPFFEDAKKIIGLCDTKKMEGFVSPIVISNIYYMMRKTYSHSECMEKFRFLLEVFEVLPTSKKAVLESVDSQFSDFEDAMQNFSAKEAEIDVIITRNIKDYKKSEISVMIPEIFLKNFQN